MTTPRRTRLGRVPDLHAFHHAIAGRISRLDPFDARACAILVPTQAAGLQLRQTIENLLLSGKSPQSANVLVWPDILTRDGWYARLHGALPNAPRLLGIVERRVLLARAAREAIDAGFPPPFRLRAVLVSEMLAFLDTVLRLGRTLDAFERLFVSELEPQAEIDRGAERLLRQTRFLVATFDRYRELVRASGCIDEHLLREMLVRDDARSALVRVIVTMGDRSTGADGLWPVDFDLLARIPHLAEIDIVSTENVLSAGFHERLLDALPGIEEIHFGQPAALAGRVPTLVAPSGREEAWWTSRDREEEMASIARRVKRPFASREDVSRAPLDRTAIVCRRPLPYVYLAEWHLGSAGVPFQAFDELPLAAEPFAAAVDLVCRFVESNFAARPLAALLRSPHFAFVVPGGNEALGADAIALFERAAREERSEAGAAGLERLAAGWRDAGATSKRRAAADAAACGAALARELEPLRGTLRASQQYDLMLRFLNAHLRPIDESSQNGARAALVRDAVLRAILDLEAAHARHDDPPAQFTDFVESVRRSMESQTFAARAGSSGVHVLDSVAARYGDFDEVYLVGLVERDWPDTGNRTIFYPLSLLGQLAWPAEGARLAAARALLTDLLRLPASRVSTSAFVLENDGLVEPSPMLDELARSGLAVAREEDAAGLRVHPDEAVSLEPLRVDVLRGRAFDWAVVRRSRSSADAQCYHGTTGPVHVEVHAVRRLETYLDCPFKYFAQNVLGLEDDSQDDLTEGPLAEGRFLHETLAAFYERWQAAGEREITPENLDAARAAFADLVGTRLAGLGPSAAALWRTRLLGSAARTGIADVVLRYEAASAQAVSRRLIEHQVDGPCLVRNASDGSERTIRIRGVADRIDVLEGRKLRIVDYKLGRAPDVQRAIQLPIYAARASQQIETADEPLAVHAAGYLAFGERVPYVGLASRGLTTDEAVAAGQQRALNAVDGIERGDFPPRPAGDFLCGYCAYSNVCRKDYVNGE